MRNFFAGLGSGSGAFVAAIVCVALLAVGVYVQSGRNDVDAPAVEALNSPSEQPAAGAVAATSSKPKSNNVIADPVAVATTDPVPEAEPTPAIPEPVTTIAAPAFEEVRRDADGVTVIAGRAAPGAEVSVLQNGSVIASAKADGSGKFATLAMIPPDGQGHILSLLETVEGVGRPSEGEIILAPTAPAAPAGTVAAQAQTEMPVGKDVGSKVALLTEMPANVENESGASADGAIAAKLDGVIATTAADPAEIATATQSATNNPAPETNAAAQSGPPSENKDSGAVTPLGDSDQAETPKAVARGEANPDTSSEGKPAAPSKVAVLRSTATGVELLNTQSPEANVALDTISYSEIGDVQLAGRAQNNTASVRVYLDNNSLANLPVDAQGRWRGELPDVDEGIYTLRVDEVSAAGKVTSRVETPFKREATEVLLAAAAEQDGPISAITVQEGATLWASARERYGDGALYVRVFEANAKAIRDPDLIYPGQVFDLPD